MKEKIRFKDLSFPIKSAVVMSWILIAYSIYAWALEILIIMLGV